MANRLALLTALGILVSCLATGAVALATGGSVAALVVASLTAAIAAIFISTFLVNRLILAPLRRLADETRRLAAGDLTASDEPSSQLGIEDVADAFNDAVAGFRREMAMLAVERERASAALANMADGIVIVNGDLRVERINDAAQRLLRHAGDAAGRRLAEVVRDHELQSVLTAALARGAAHSELVRLAPPAGSAALEQARYVKATGIPIGDGGRMEEQAGLLVLQDVTALRRTETMRREFVGNVSHELRTPIASLKALVETLEEGALDDPPAAREFLGQMHVEVDSLAQLVQELLELSKIESGQSPLRREPVPPAGLLEEAYQRLRRQAERAGIKVQVDAARDLPLVLADPALVERTLINLLHNAAKFTPKGGRIVLSAAPHPDGICLSVADTGQGIAAPELDRIFERFYKADKSRASGGTGLGLAIAKHIVQAHGGRIWAESPGEGHGATFKFTLPIAPADGAAPTTAIDAPGASPEQEVTAAR